MAALPPVLVEDRQLAVLAVLAVHVVATTMTRRLVKAQQRGQATVAKVEAAQGRCSKYDLVYVIF